MSRSIRRGMAMVFVALMGLGATGGPVLARPLNPSASDRPLDSPVPETREADAPTVERAQALQQAGRWEEAAEVWGQIAQQDPENGEAWHYLGYCLHAAGRLEEAIEAHRKASTFDDYHGIALYNLGCAYALAGRPEEAFEALASAQEAGWRIRDYAFSDSDLESLRQDPRLGELLAREPAGMRGRIQMVLARARQFVDQNAPQAKQQLAGLMQQVAQQAQGMLGQLQQKLAQDEQFAGMMQKLAQDERFAPLLQRLQGLLGGGGAPGAPPGAAGEAGPPVPPEVMAMVEKAQQHQQAGEWAEAAAIYGTMIEHAPDNAQLCFALAYSLHMAGDYEKAIEAHQRSAGFDQTRGIALYNLACAYALTGHTDEALKALEASREAGFDISAARSDSDLESLRGDARFEAILAGG